MFPYTQYDLTALGGMGAQQQTGLGSLFAGLGSAGLFKQTKAGTVKRIKGTLLSFAKEAVTKREYTNATTHECECGDTRVTDEEGYWSTVETAPAVPESRSPDVIQLNLDERDAQVLARLLSHCPSYDPGSADRREDALARIKSLLRDEGIFSFMQNDHPNRTMFEGRISLYRLDDDGGVVA